MADPLFVDMRRFAAPPGRPYAGERFERRPRPQRGLALLRRWLARWHGTEADPFAMPAYLPSGHRGQA